MKALVDVAAKVNGVQYSVPAGREVPAALLAYWTSTGALDKLRTQGAIEADTVAELDEKSNTKSKVRSNL